MKESEADLKAFDSATLVRDLHGPQWRSNCVRAPGALENLPWNKSTPSWMLSSLL